MSDGPTTTVAAQRPLRRDAERNRIRILASAKVLFAEHGVDVSLDDIARHAGVGVGTVYRRFPDREALIDELFEDKISEIEELAAASLAIDDPWEGLVDVPRALAGEARRRPRPQAGAARAQPRRRSAGGGPGPDRAARSAS